VSDILVGYNDFVHVIIFGVLITVVIIFINTFLNKNIIKINSVNWAFLEVLCVIIPTFLVCSLVYYSLLALYDINVAEN